MLAVTGCGAEVTELHDLAYDDRFGARTTMDVYLPADDGGGARPAVLVVHGGGWRSGSKADQGFAARKLAASGYVAASINYRLTPTVQYPAPVKDAWCALSFLRAHAEEWRLDPARVAAMGYSAGAHLVSMLGVAGHVVETQPDCAFGPTAPPVAVVSGAGVQDLTLIGDFPETTAFVGGTRAQVPERFSAASPITHVQPRVPPFLLISGSSDWVVPVQQQYVMRDALLAAGGTVQLLVLAGAGHVLNPSGDFGAVQTDVSTETPEAWAATIDFLRTTLGAPR